MFRHIVLLTLVPEATDEDRRAIVEELETLPSIVGALRSYEVRLDAGLADDNAHIAVVADFDDEAGYVEYRDDPTHRRIIETRIAPVLAARRASQFRR